VGANVEAEKKSEGPKSDEKATFAEMWRGMMSGEMPECCGPVMQAMMSRWAGAFSTPKRP